jgi:hypothetical protein
MERDRQKTTTKVKTYIKNMIGTVEKNKVGKGKNQAVNEGETIISNKVVREGHIKKVTFEEDLK